MIASSESGKSAKWTEFFAPSFAAPSPSFKSRYSLSIKNGATGDPNIEVVRRQETNV